MSKVTEFIVTFIGVSLIFAVVLFAAGCSEDFFKAQPTPREAQLAQPEFTPRTREFKLEDGTPCVMAWTPPDTSRRAGSSGISCDWKENQQ